MVYPIIKPPVHPSVIFSLEKKSQCCNQTQERDPNLHPLFGFSTHEYTWPGTSLYQDSYCWGGDGNTCMDDGYTVRQPLPWPCGPQIQQRHQDTGMEQPTATRHSKQSQPRFDKLYETIPLPLLDKHYTGYYYRIDDPVGVVTVEERTKCRQTAFGPVTFRTKDEMDSTYIPNYRYKEWVKQPHIEILKQKDCPSPFCRLPQPDTRYYDLYNRVRMHRPTRSIKTGYGFDTCLAVPIPKDDHEFPNIEW